MAEPRVSFDSESGTLEVSSFGGQTINNNFSKLANYVKNPLVNSKWHFFRQADNHAYVGAEVSYNGDCSNSLIISPYRNNALFDVRNTFILVQDSYVHSSSISNVLDMVSKGREALSRHKVVHHIPKTVHERENLNELNSEEIKKKISRTHGIKISQVSSIRKGVYHLQGGGGQDYVLKFIGRNKEQAESILRIAKGIPDYFPRIFNRVDCQSDLTLRLNDGFYGLEEFIKSPEQKRREAGYFLSLGEHLGLIHNKLSTFSKKDKGADEFLFSKSSHTGESSIASVYLDLLIEGEKCAPLVTEIQDIIEKDLSEKMRRLPSALIHRDINHSNVLWFGDKPTFIDLETMKKRIRIEEFESPLLFFGNMKRPGYVRGSLCSIIEGYVKTADLPLLKEEIDILPFLLKYALLRNFVVRNIRRNEGNPFYFQEVIKNLRKISEDTR